MTGADVIAVLRGKRILITNEKEVQRQLADIFVEAGLALAREVRVEGGIVDFAERPRGLAVEVKVKGSTMSFYRQMQDYSFDPTIDEMLLVTARACAMPPTINGKRVRVFGLGGAHL